MVLFNYEYQEDSVVVEKWVDRVKAEGDKLQEENKSWQACFIKLSDEAEQKLDAIQVFLKENLHWNDKKKIWQMECFTGKKLFREVLGE